MVALAALLLAGAAVLVWRLGAETQSSNIAETRSLKELMAAAQAEFDARRFEEAVRGFGAAARLAPDDPRVRGNLGWAAYRARQFELAERETEKALDLLAVQGARRALTPAEQRRKASFLFNLGLLLERRDAPEAARRLYSESLLLRPHPVVEKRLKRLQPRADAGP